jgi:hypothetical protein
LTDGTPALGSHGRTFVSTLRNPMWNPMWNPMSWTDMRPLSLRRAMDGG